jgi:hypothetical protein
MAWCGRGVFALNACRDYGHQADELYIDSPYNVINVGIYTIIGGFHLQTLDFLFIFRPQLFSVKYHTHNNNERRR